VDAGIYTYHLEQSGNQWVLVRNGDAPPPPNTPPDGGNPTGGGNPPSDPGTPPPDTLSPAAKTALSMASAIPDIFYNEIGTLRLRQGDLRANRAGDGLWARSFTSLDKYDTTAAPAFDMDQYGLVVGADKRLLLKSGDLYVGAMGTYSYSDVKIGGGSSGRVNSYSLGAYATWLMENGWYLNGILKANTFDNDLRVIGSDGRGSRGHYNMPGFGATVELGKHIKLANDGFMEPYTQISGFTANSSHDNLDNGFDIHNGNTKSLRGEIGLLGGQNFEIKNGFIQPYMKGAFIHEFVDGNRTVLNNTSFNEDMSGTRMLAGVGVAAQVKKNLQFHLDADYTTGGVLNQAVNVTLGMRYVW
jgi:outer membrane autotransporter protein